MATKMERGLLLIERDSEHIWRNLPGEERETLLKYRGFDSLLRWEVESTPLLKLDRGLASMADYEKVRMFYEDKKLATNSQVDLLIVERIKTSGLKNNLLDNFSFIGCDVGVLEEFNEPIFFSLILNELRINGNRYLRNVISKLNKKYLFDTVDDCLLFLKLREDALSDKEIVGLETSYTNRDIEITNIYLHKH